MQRIDSCKFLVLCASRNSLLLYKGLGFIITTCRFQVMGCGKNGGLLMASGKDFGRWMSEIECWIPWQFLIHPFS